ncbi:DUF58 domain-containing protein [Demequina sp. TTPB684]|uniref:DUF58 domain-containing protein n=1 Tax=unclassified Demequina TaxID=2620311 RepID=UPI001CF28FFA|nr:MULTISPECIES: DUF58 domain-containing protein [unclassified Demequina]MCB2413185.1 DUF58 domain-containing protein [Demequina sp. TTPB684]UPU88360.1 DUF58 domain-containing protein [Demequina sp. TMPB413]
MSAVPTRGDAVAPSTTTGAHPAVGMARAWVTEVAAPFAAPIVRPLRTVVGWFTGLGAVVLAGTAIALGVVGMWGWLEFLTIAAIGGAALVMAAFFLVGRIAYDASLNLALTRVVVGERAVGGIELRNPTKRALLPVLVELPVGKGLASFAIPRLGAGESHDDVFTIPTHRRAVLPVGPITAVRGDPLGLLARVVTWTDPVDLYVHPRTVSLEGSSSGFLQDLEGLPSKDLSNSDIAFHALREYVPGDDRRHVHWKSTARTGQLMVRQFEETRRSHLAISLSLNGDEYETEDQFELGVSVAGSLGLQALKEDKQLSVLVQGAQLPTRSGKQFLDSLSRLENTDARRGTFVDLALRTGTAVPDASVAVIVCGGAVTPADIRLAATHIPLGVLVVAIYCTPDAPLTRRTIGDIVVLTIGDLRDLPHAMRRLAA